MRSTAAKPYWQPGWLKQHDRLMAAMSEMKGRMPLIISGDMHAIADVSIGGIARHVNGEHFHTRREFSSCARMRGGAGRTRTNNQTVKECGSSPTSSPRSLASNKQVRQGLRSRHGSE